MRTRSLAALLFVLLVALAGASLTLVEPDPAPSPDASAPQQVPLGRAGSTAAPTSRAPQSPSAPAASSAPASAAPAAEVTTASNAAQVEPALVIGTVRWPDGRAAARVAIHGIGEVHAHGGGTFSDAAGLFSVPVPAGRFEVQAWSPDRKAVAAGAFVAEGGRRLTLDLTLVPLVPLAVWLVGPDGERRRAEWLRGEPLEAPVLGVLLGLRGELLVPPGRLRVTAEHPDGSPRAAAEVEVGAAPAELVLQVEAARRLEGIVVGPDDLPVANIEVECRRAPREGPRPWSDTGRSWSGRTDAVGRFALDGLPADRLVLLARRVEGRWLGQVTVELETREVRLPLAATSALRGRLVFPAAAHVMVPIDLRLRGAAEPVRYLHTTPSHDDAFSCEWLQGGVYDVSVDEDWLPRIARALGVPRVTVSPVEVTLSGGRDAEVELQVVLAP